MMSDYRNLFTNLSFQHKLTIQLLMDVSLCIILRTRSEEPLRRPLKLIEAEDESLYSKSSFMCIVIGMIIIIQNNSERSVDFRSLDIVKYLTS